MLHYPVLQKSTVKEVIAELKAQDKSAIAQTSRVFYQGKYDAKGYGKFGFFEKIPDRFLKNEASWSNYNQYYDEKQAK